ncbi:hypothetical protein F5Y18DRAFT_434092 [Xylariaceae sp. FL1019]|nr:hypothetical protein F5Y18DRAFT_434092 [Xylariaceae sp. FL1019]
MSFTATPVAKVDPDPVATDTTDAIDQSRDYLRDRGSPGPRNHQVRSTKASPSWRSSLAGSLGSCWVVAARAPRRKCDILTAMDIISAAPVNGLTAKTIALRDVTGDTVQPSSIPEVRYSKQHEHHQSRPERGARQRSRRSSRRHRDKGRSSRHRSPPSPRSPSPSEHRHHFDDHHRQETPDLLVQPPTIPPVAESAPAPLVCPPANALDNASVQPSAGAVLSPPASVQPQRLSRGRTGRNSTSGRSVSRLTATPSSAMTSPAPSTAVPAVDSSFDAPGLNLTRTNLAHVAETKERA